MEPSDSVAIVGAGFSGAMLAARLLERGRSVVLIERSGVFGRGLAYSTSFDAHLLNVRSGRMSARADDPGHFVRWLEATGAWDADPNGFAPRRVYGDYVQAVLAQAEAAAPGRLSRVTGEAVELQTDEHGVRLGLGDGRVIEAGAAVLATGNPPPDAGVAPGGAVIGDPWAPGALDAVGTGDEVVLLGTGLTMIDMVLALDQRGWTGRAHAISRRGLLPRPHGADQPHHEPWRPAPGPLSRRLAQARARAGADWGGMMDSLRTQNAALWTALDADQRRRFLRHLRPWWDVHRHRTAPQIGRRIARLQAEGRLAVSAGRIERVLARASGVEVEWRPRGGREVRRERADVVIDCTGPAGDPGRSHDPLTRSLVAAGRLRPDPLRLGLDVDPDGRVLDARGRPQSRLWALGPPTKAALWEIVAVPDIREQVEALARRLG